MIHRSVLLALLLVPGLVIADPHARTAPPPGSGDFDQSHAAFTELLGRHVSSAGVNYPGLVRDRDALDAYLRSLEGVTREQLAGFTEAERLAFWINTYNAYTLWLVSSHWPVDSIRSIGSLFRSVFKIAFIPFQHSEGKVLSLDDVEHGIIRVRFSEPRIHFAVNCAARDCPPLRNEAFTGARLEAQLEEQTRSFLTQGRGLRWDAGSKTLHLTRVMRWFSEDFEPSPAEWALPYLPEDAAAAVRAGEGRVRYLPYDWSVNLARDAGAGSN